jgi:hypothetical protein
MARTNGLEERLAALEETMNSRIAALERQLAEVRQQLEQATQKDWRSTIGMFSGSEMMKRIDEAGRKIREADRARARKVAERERQRAKR